MSKKAAVIFGGLAIVGIAFAASSKKANASELKKLPVQPKTDEDEQKEAEEAATRANVKLEKSAKAGLHSSQIEAEITEAVVNALATGNPSLIRATAERLEAVGYAYVDSMLRAAEEMEKDLAKSKARNVTLKRVKEILATIPTRGAATPSATKPSAAPTVVSKPAAKPPAVKPKPVSPTLVDIEPKKPEPPITKPATAPLNSTRTPEFAEGQLRAAKLALHLQSAKKYKENRAMVKEFQGFEQLKQDGMYGPKVALEIGSYGMVPPAPFYWPTDWVRGKREYRAGLLQLATEYPEKAQEFREAAERIKIS